MSSPSEKSRPGRPRSEAARTAILEATLSLLRDKGIKDFTIEAVASRAKVGRSTIYRWWPTRMELIIEAMETLPAMPRPDTGSLLGDLREMALAYARMLRTTPLGAVLAHIMAEEAAQDPAIQAFIAARTVEGAEIVSRAQVRGELPAGPEASKVVGMVLGPILTANAFGGQRVDDQHVEMLVRTVVLGYPLAAQALGDAAH